VAENRQRGADGDAATRAAVAQSLNSRPGENGLMQ
jgi:hypothetical protein